jgi:hypothetical protein
MKAAMVLSLLVSGRLERKRREVNAAIEIPMMIILIMDQLQDPLNRDGG